MSAQDKPVDGPMKVSVVFVHGIGQQARGSTLLAWAEPLVRVIDQCSRSYGGRGAQVVTSTLSGDEGSQVVVRADFAGTNDRVVTLSEARWADAFIAMSPQETAGWALRFALGAVRRALTHVARMRHVARGTLNRYLDLLPSGPPPALTNPAIFPLAALGALILLLLLYRASIMIVFALTLLAVTPVLLLVAALGLILLAVGNRIPVLGARLAPLIAGLTTSIGDAGAWTSRPLRAAAMRDVVRAEVSRVGAGADSVVVVAHSQGAAVALDVALGEDAATEPKIDLLVTVGAGISLLKSPGFTLMQPAAFRPVRAWSSRPSPKWVNIWAPWDLVSSGPIADTPQEQRLRWLEAYDKGEEQRRARAQHEEALADERERRYRLVHHGETPTDLSLALIRSGMDAALIDAAYSELGLPDHVSPLSSSSSDQTSTRPVARGPEEWPVDNRASILRDHTTYTSNIVQVMEPLADVVLALPEDAARARLSAKDPAAARRLVSQTVHQLSFFRSLALVVAVILSPRIAESLDRHTLLEWAPVQEWLAEGSIRPVLGDALSRPLGEYLWLAATGVALFLVLAVLGNVLWQWLYTDLSWNARSTAFGWKGLPFQAAYLTLCLTTPLLVFNEAPRSGADLAGAAVLAAVVYSTPWMSVLPACIPGRKTTADQGI